MLRYSPLKGKQFFFTFIDLGMFILNFLIYFKSIVTFANLISWKIIYDIIGIINVFNFFFVLLAQYYFNRYKR